MSNLQSNVVGGALALLALVIGVGGIIVAAVLGAVGVYSSAALWFVCGAIWVILAFIAMTLAARIGATPEEQVMDDDLDV